MPQFLRRICLGVSPPSLLNVFLVVAVLSIDAARAAEFNPEIVVVPESGAPGTTVEIFGSGFPSFSTVIVGFSQNGVDQILGFASTEEDGTFSTTVDVPEDVEGGLASFFVEGSLGRTEVDYFVTESETIGDRPGPSPDKVALCEEVIIIERVVNRLDTMDETFEFVTLDQIGFKRVRVEAKNGEVTRVAEILSRQRYPKSSYPRLLDFPIFVNVVRPDEKSFKAAQVNPVYSLTPEPTSKRPKIDCPGSRLLEFTEEKGVSIELKDKSSAKKLGFIDLVCRVIVREVQSQ